MVSFKMKDFELLKSISYKNLVRARGGGEGWRYELTYQVVWWGGGDGVLLNLK